MYFKKYFLLFLFSAVAGLEGYIIKISSGILKFFQKTFGIFQKRSTFAIPTSKDGIRVRGVA
jgi:hypothetical protein